MIKIQLALRRRTWSTLLGVCNDLKSCTCHTLPALKPKRGVMPYANDMNWLGFFEALR